MSSRIKELEEILLMLSYTKTQLEYLLLPIQDLLKNLASKKELNKLKFIYNTEQYLNLGLSFYSAWEKAITEHSKLSDLKTEDINLLVAFGKEFGTTDLKGQLKLCSLYEKLIEEELERAKSFKEKYNELYSALGILGGIAAAILLI